MRFIYALLNQFLAGIPFTANPISSGLDLSRDCIWLPILMNVILASPFGLAKVIILPATSIFFLVNLHTTIVYRSALSRNQTILDMYALN